jgi:hypothetical protein
MFLVATELDGRTTLRLVVGSPQTQPRHVSAAWDLIREQAAALLQQELTGAATAATVAARAG